jgi:hypothetical protein
MDKKEANLLPRICAYEESSSSSESSDESTDSEMQDPRLFRGNQTSSLNNIDLPDYKSVKKIRKKRMKKKQSKWSTYWSRYKRFVHSPRVHFVYDALFYCVFLLLFSYMILCEFNYYEEIEQTVEVFPRSTLFLNKTNTDDLKKFNKTNETSNSTFIEFRRRVIKMPSWIEYLLIYWMFAFVLEEARQYFFGDAETKILKNKLLHYFENNWNYLDISGCLVFSIGMSLRFISMNSNENLFIAARYLAACNLKIYVINNTSYN